MNTLLKKAMSTLVRKGNVDVTLSDGSGFQAGDGSGTPIAVRLSDRTAEWRLLKDPELALGELYMDGLLTITAGGIYDLVEIALLNLEAGNGPRWVKGLEKARIAIRRLVQHNEKPNSQRNAAHHYDIDARLYSLFLDSDRQYSCAYFEREGQSLEDAQLAKKRHIAAKLALAPGQRVLDIGCGWGGLGLYLGEFCESKVTGITLSKEQLAVANQRAEERGLDGSVRFALQDYRYLDSKYDRIVSVGMFEHVGVGYFDAYFAAIANSLEDDGVALVHTIGRTDGPGATNPWITKYIFPGGYIPAMSEAVAAIERAGLLVTDVEILRLHYAKTLRAWRERFIARRGEVLAIYDERFFRMWEFYLAASEASFRLGEDVVFQFQLAKRVDALPLTRDYIRPAEHRLRALDSRMAEARFAGE